MGRMACHIIRFLYNILGLSVLRDLLDGHWITIGATISSRLLFSFSLIQVKIS